MDPILTLALAEQRFREAILFSLHGLRPYTAFVSFLKEICTIEYCFVKRSVGRPKEVTDEQIVAAARPCFLERGTGVSAVEIARNRRS